jgi:hypothetical protein
MGGVLLYNPYERGKIARVYKNNFHLVKPWVI